MWTPLLVLIGGFTALVWSAEKFSSGAASTAINLGVSKMMIGLTVVAVGTSAPEILVAVTASLEGNPQLAVGNAIGSNIANIGLVLGITATVAPLPFSKAVLKNELLWLITATLLALFLLFDLQLSILDSVVLLTGLCLILYRLYQTQKRSTNKPLPEAIEKELDVLADLSMGPGIFWLVVGLVVLVASAKVLVWAATQIAVALGVSDLIIGLTVVAIGTSLPELVITITTAVKGHPEIAIGNVLGSNIVNILVVLAVPGIIDSTGITMAALLRDGGMMLALTLLLALFACGINSRSVIIRFEGAVLVAAWLGYIALLIQQA